MCIMARPCCSQRSTSPPALSSANATSGIGPPNFWTSLNSSTLKSPKDLDVHIIMDDYATHKTAAIRAWLARRPHYHVHFTPTSASWINQVEGWFAELTRKKLRRGVHTSTSQLEADIRSFIEWHNENPKPYKWTKSADEILSVVKRFCQRQSRLYVTNFRFT